MFQVIAAIVPDYLNELAALMATLTQYFAGGVLVAFIGWAIGYAVRALFDMVEFMTL